MAEPSANHQDPSQAPVAAGHRWGLWLAGAGGLALLALGLVWVSTICIGCEVQGASGNINLRNWLSFLAVLILAAFLLGAGWWAVQASERVSLGKGLPGWLGGLLIGAMLLRLALGLVWFLSLPPLGHGTKQEMNGYVMADAYERDQYAQKMAESPKSLLEVVQSGRRVDTFGGLFFISVLVYRYLGTTPPTPLSMLVVTAALSSLSVLLTWAFARRSWDERVAAVAAWGIALYPETVLLGSSQMREALIITLVAAAFYGLARLRRRRSWIGLAWLLGGILLTMLVSPPLTLMLVFALFLAALAIKDELLHKHVEIHRWAWLVLAGVILLALVGGWFALRQFAPAEITNPIEVLSYWLRKSADLQAYFSKSASGWLQKIFRATPEWSHLPILVSYGALRPFLPAALAVSSDAPIWSWITLWRALGWTILLGMLVYAFLHAWFKKGSDRFTRALTIIIWLGILIASLRGGGDQDDNPRYRATFASIQVALAAWGWVEQRQSADPVFRRALATVAFVIGWSFLWYLRRLYPIPWIISDPFKIIGLGLACGALYSLWDWARTHSAPQP